MMGGWDAKNRNTINPVYLCRVCSLILREPVQLECGHRQCKNCTETIAGTIIICAECGQETVKTKILPDRGCRNDMKSMEIQCSLYEWNGLFEVYEAHLHQQHSNPRCEYCGQRFDSINGFYQHRQTSCVGRNLTGLTTANRCSISIPDNNLSNNHSNTIHRNEASNSSDHIGHETSNSRHERSVDMEINIGETTPILVLTNTNQNPSTQTQEILETVNVLANATLTLQGDIQRLWRYHNQLRALLHASMTDAQTLQTINHEQNDRIREVQYNYEILQQNIATLRQTVEELENTSYDGTLMWKITNVGEKITNTQTERRTSMDSRSFYSVRGGYKLCVRLYLNRGRNVRRTHLSLFFILMNGPNDAILHFPFKCNVAFCLHDQTSNQQHIIKSLHSDIQSRDAQRSRLAKNIASGIPNFVRLSTLQQEGNPYVRDDSMFIQVMVDFANMPRTLLPYAFSLDPGMPMSIRQQMIEQEADRRSQQQ